MRLDLFLKFSRLAPRRSSAQQMCDAGAVTVNGDRSKSAKPVKPGDVLAIRQRGRITTVRIVSLPDRPPSKAEARSLYETIGVDSYDPF